MPKMHPRIRDTEPEIRKYRYFLAINYPEVKPRGEWNLGRCLRGKGRSCRRVYRNWTPSGRIL